MSIFQNISAPEEDIAPSVEMATEVAPEPATTDVVEIEAQQVPDEGHPADAAATTDPLAAHRDPKTGMLLGRFKTMDDFVNGYQELRRQMSREGVGKAQDLVDAVMGRGEAPAAPQTQPANQAQVQTPQQNPANAEQFRQQVAQAMQQDPAGTVAQLTQMAARQMLQQYVVPLYERVQASEMKAVMSEMAMTHPDFAALAPNISDLLKTRPHLRQLVLQNPAAIEDVYRMAKSDLGGQAIVAAREAGAQGAIETLQRKVAAGGVPGNRASNPAKQNVSEEQSVVDAIFEPTRGRGIFDPV